MEESENLNFPENKDTLENIDQIQVNVFDQEILKKILEFNELIEEEI